MKNCVGTDVNSHEPLALCFFQLDKKCVKSGGAIFVANIACVTLRHISLSN